MYTRFTASHTPIDSMAQMHVCTVNCGWVEMPLIFDYKADRF